MFSDRLLFSYEDDRRLSFRSKLDRRESELFETDDDRVFDESELEADRDESDRRELKFDRREPRNRRRYSSSSSSSSEAADNRAPTRPNEFRANRPHRLCGPLPPPTTITTTLSSQPMAGPQGPGCP